MKKITLLLIVCFGLQFATYSQGCLPNGLFVDSQEELDNFQTNYPNCTQIEGFVTINGDDITDLSSLSNITSIGEHLIITSCELLTNLSGLDNLTYVGGFVNIIDDTSLVSIEALSSLTQVDGNLAIWETSLENFEGLNSLTNLGGSLTIRENNKLTTLEGLEGLTTIVEDLSINKNHSLETLDGISGLTTVGVDFRISNNSVLPNLVGLEQLASVGGSLSILQNHLFVDLFELQSLTTIGGKLWILQNKGLESLDGLNNVTTIGGDLEIRLNSDLASIEALSVLTTLEGILIIEGNSYLTTLEGLDNIEPSTIDAIEINDNNYLATCEVQSICDYIATPGAIVNISDNSANCNSEDAVILACQLVDDPELLFSNYYTIYPNPANDELRISVNNNAITGSVNIYNQFGQKVISNHKITKTIDISNLISGLYIIEIDNGRVRLRDRLIVL